MEQTGSFCIQPSSLCFSSWLTEASRNSACVAGLWLSISTGDCKQTAGALSIRISTCQKGIRGPKASVQCTANSICAFVLAVFVTRGVTAEVTYFSKVFFS